MEDLSAALFGRERQESFFRENEIKAENAARKLVKRLASKKLTLALAESCTGGLISEIITRVSGASAVLWGSFVCYSPSAKKKMLCIDEDLLVRFGLVSGETAGEMAAKAMEISGAVLAASVTGLADPVCHLDTEERGVRPGTVWIAVAGRGDSGRDRIAKKKLFFRGSRAEVRIQAAVAVLEELLATVDNF